MDQHSSDSPVAPATPPAEESHRPVKKRRHRWIWVVVLLLFGLLFYWVIQHHAKTQAAAGGGRHQVGGIIPVTIATAHSGDVNIYQDAIGTVTPVHTASITAQASGVVTAVHFREGQMVHKGDPLIDLDPRPYLAQLAQAQGALERDQNLLAEAKMDEERYKQAWAKNAIPRQTLEDQEKLVMQDEGTVKNDEGTVQYDQVQVSYCHIVAPFDGRVGLRLVDPGNLITANATTTLVVVTQLQPITVIFTLAEDSIPQVMQQTRGKKQLQVQAYDRTQKALLSTGKLTSIDNQIDTTTGTVKLRAEFDNRNTTMFPNQFVNTRLLVNTLHDQTLIPSSAIQHNGSQDFVYVLQNVKTGKPITNESECTTREGNGQPAGSARESSQGSTPPKKGQQPAAPTASCNVSMRTVKSGNSDNGETAVQGIEPGDVVANSSFEKLQNGSQISVSKVKLPSTSDAPESPIQ